MNILDKIIIAKHKEVALRKQQVSLQTLEKSPYFIQKVRSMVKSLEEKAPAAIIAEFKRRSPSKGNIFNDADVRTVVPSYEAAGCAGISVLTDEAFFGGKLTDLISAREVVDVPLLRKEFIIDEFQILESKSAGADLILLIAEVLTQAQVLTLARFAHSLGLEVLLEMHSADEVPKINKYIDIVGINNRNLKTFEVDTDASIRLVQTLQGNFKKISESGLSEASTVDQLSRAGFEGFLVGENFMKTGQPGLACQQFIEEIKALGNKVL